MSAAPSGVVTFLFTDIESSTVLWERAPDAMRHALQRHNDLVRAAVSEHGGVVFATGGDGFAIAFQHASDAVAAATEAQSRLREEEWPAEACLRVRMGLHTGEAVEQQGDYVGTAVNETARLMASAHGGQVVCSASTAALSGDLVALKDLGQHRLRDLPRPVHAYQVGDGDFPRLRSLDAQPGNLPVQLTSFLGRERDVTNVADALDRSRLVTLVGVGGMGKTRLALGVADEVASQFRDGAWFVELAAIADSDAVSQVVAATLGISQRTGLSLVDSIAEYLRTWQLLIVLDNCEHVLGAAAELAERLLRGCPGAKILATSREALGCSAEQLWPVGPLALPDGSNRTAASVELFVERARLVSPKFDPGAAGTAAIADICRRLDGMPLAIELAASRVASMSPMEIAQLLDERFRLLTGGRRSAVERHQSLRAAVEWSYGLLSDCDRRVFARFGVFAGSFDAASAVAIGSGADFDEWEVREALASLVSKSLLGTVETSAASTRYQLAETLRAYARECLDASEPADEWRRRHAEHFAAFARQAAAGLQGPEEPPWWDRLEDELDNLRTAVTWALDHESDAQLAVEIITDLALASATEPRLGIHGWAEQAMFAAEDAAPGRRAVLRAMTANHMHVTGQPTAVVRPIAEAAVSDGIPSECPAPSVIVLPLAVCEVWEGDLEACIQTVRQATVDIESLGYGVYHRYSAGTLVVAFASAAGDHETAAADAETVLSFARETGCPTAIAHALSLVGWALAITDPDAARKALTTAVSLAEAGARVAAKDLSLIVLARLHADNGDLEQARRFAHAAISETLRQGDQQLAWGALKGIIAIAERLGDLHLIATLVGATLRGSRRVPENGMFMLAGGDASLEKIAAVARKELGEDAWHAAERRGAAMEIGELGNYVLAALARDRSDADVVVAEN
ncbi:MAG TPA: adenylate/guanylate cyclase domain-containing protein [Acidimicrobiales bacterium]|nr:adenylate/guanylate cyclase domain-containing protein [Acidimicrobiales bacterium]